MNKEKNLILGILLLLGIITFSTAAGIGFSTYSTEYPLKMYPGQEATLEMELQVGEGQQAITFLGEEKIDEANVFGFVHENPEYVVGSGERAKVPVRISVPTTANLGDTYLVWITFSERDEAKETGMVNFISRLNYQFNVQVVTKEESLLYQPETTTPTPEVKEPMNLTWLYVLLVIVVIIGIGYLLYNKKNNNKK